MTLGLPHQRFIRFFFFVVVFIIPSAVVWSKVCDKQRASFVASPCRRHIHGKPNHAMNVVSSYHQSTGSIFRSHKRTALQLSKKKSAPAPTKKIQVKMLKYVEGTGHVGEVVMVTPAFFQNKLRPSTAAIVITDEEVKKERSDAEALEKETCVKAEALKEQISQLSISFRRKAGSDGHLFGGIGAKCIMNELDKSVGDAFLSQKSVRIVSITKNDGSSVDGDIKYTGAYTASLSLTKDISGSFGVVVEAES
jgi:large subunit ribosomal protein L9